MGKDPAAPCAQHRTCRLPLAGGRVRVPRPDPISLTQVSLQSRAKPAGVAMPSPQASLLVPGEHCLCGRGLLRILPDLEPRVGLA